MTTAPKGLTRRRALLAFAGSTALAGTRTWSAEPARCGLDLTAMDRSTRPGDDFARYANGVWADRYALKDDEVYAGARTRISDLRRDRVRTLIEDAARAKTTPSTLEGQVGALYASWMDPVGSTARGFTAAAPELARIDAVASHADLPALFGMAPQLGLASPFEASLFYDFHEPGRMRYTLTPGGLGLPTREHYLEDRYAEVRAAYLTYVEDMLKRAGEPEPGSAAQTVLALETALARNYWPTVEAYDFVKTSNNRSPAELAASAPAFDWQAFLTAAKADGMDVLIVKQPSAMAPTTKVIADTPIGVWKSWLRFHLISDNADYLGDTLDAARFDFYGRVLQGQKSPRPRWARGVDLVEGFLGQQLGKLYAERFFSAEDKAVISAIFENVRAVMRDRIQAAGWMSAATRAEAIRKIDTLNVKIGYPDRWPDFPAYDFRPDDLYENLRRGRIVRWADRMASARRPVARDEWQTTPQNTSAAANPAFNEITVPAGTLVRPFFDAKSDPAVNYGAIGGVLGHELSHMFDQVGRKLDADGRLRDWWAGDDGAKYDAIAAKVERQYSAFEVLPGRFLNGKQTLNENIADISGLGIAFEAWHRSLKGKRVASCGGLSGEQRFFLGWAQMRASKEREAFLAGQLATGVHSPDRYRINGVVRNLDAWYVAFAVKPGDTLYLAPSERAKFW